MIGTTLGPYEIVDKLGAGGMGEVWRARDSKLEREVAIKLLPDDFADDPERLARFEREAKLLASLNHANIAAIYDLDDADGKRFIAMELVEGESLAERMETGRIALDDALEIARQIAAALEAAHDNGVIHRDLKPANIMVTPAGVVKVLDFGLAKAYAPDGSPSDISPDISNSPTIVNATRSGMIVGTAAYMSPEQAAGAAVDNRTDIWAFGVVLYEMLSGGRLFHGESAAHVLADVLKTEPDLDRLAPETPAEIHRLVRRCLHKKAERRLHHVADAWLVIEEVIAGTHDEGLPESVASATGQGAAAGQGLALSLPRAAMLAAVVLLAGIAGGWWYANRNAPAPEPLRTFDVFGALAVVESVAISPDGETLAIVGAEEAEGDNRLYLRHLDDTALVPLPDTDNARRPFFSPTGDWIGFWVRSPPSDWRLRKVSLDGVALNLHTFDNAVSLRGGWDDDDTILIGTSSERVRVPASGGATSVVIAEHDDYGDFASPTPLPGGRILLQLRQNSAEGFRRDIAVYSPDDDTIEVLVEDVTTPRFVPPGHLLYGRRGSVWRVGFDPAGATIRGTEQLVRQGVRANSQSTGYDAATNGTLAYVPGPFIRTAFAQTPENELIAVDREGNIEVLPIDVDDTNSIGLAPDGRRIAVGRRSDDQQTIFVYDMLTGAGDRLAAGAEFNGRPRWSADPEWVYFGATEGEHAPREIFRARPGFGGEAPEPLGEGMILDVSHDGRVVYTEHGGVDLALLPVDDDGAPDVLLDTENDVLSARFSPDGRFIAFARNGPTLVNVYVWDSERRVTTPVSPTGGSGPAWSADGTGLFYIAGDIGFTFSESTGVSYSTGATPLVLMRVPVSVVDGRFDAGAPEPYFSDEITGTLALNSLIREGFEVARDGKLVYARSDAFAAVEQVPDADRVRVVLNGLAAIRGAPGVSR